MIRFRGQPVSAGIAAGELYLADPQPAPAAAGGLTADDVRAAFAAVAAERTQLADRLRAAGRTSEAGIVQIGALIAADHALVGPALAGLGAPDAPAGPDPAAGGTPPPVSVPVPVPVAVAAVRDAAEAQAAILEALPDPDLAQRAGDVRQVAAAVITRLTSTAAPAPPPGPFILVRPDVDPADLIRLADAAPPATASHPPGTDPAGSADPLTGAVSAGTAGHLVGAVSVGGGASSHAAIIARGLGLPMLSAADEAVLTAPAGHTAILDAITGELIVDPSSEDLARVSAQDTLPPLTRVSAETQPGGSGGSPPRASTAAETQPGPRREIVAGQARTADGELVTVLCNVASAAETRLGLAGGAAGVGLLRTEIPFTHASTWPSRADHFARLRPILGLLDGKKAVVRLLDFSGDKIPPFPGAEGLRALLEAPGALGAQLDAILEAGGDADLAVMIPMVRSLDEAGHVRGELAAAAKRAGAAPPPLGIMIEVAETAADADRFAPHVDFFSIGTNDLSADVLRRDRAGLPPSAAAERPVVALVAHVVGAARQAGIGVSVCGDSAADPAVLPLLIGAGVRTVSVGAANVPRVAGWIARTDAAEAAAKVAERYAG